MLVWHTSLTTGSQAGAHRASSITHRVAHCNSSVALSIVHHPLPIVSSAELPIVRCTLSVQVVRRLVHCKSSATHCPPPAFRCTSSAAHHLACCASSITHHIVHGTSSIARCLAHRPPRFAHRSVMSSPSSAATSRPLPHCLVCRDVILSAATPPCPPPRRLIHCANPKGLAARRALKLTGGRGGDTRYSGA